MARHQKGLPPARDEKKSRTVSDDDILAALERLTTYYPVAIDMGLDRVFRLLHDLGDPHLNLPPVIHIAGTNGKGSTLAFTRAILEAAGKKVHAFTSPHLVRYNERVTLAGEEISNAFLLDCLNECERVNADRPITFFEITAIASFLAFSRVDADYVLLETGMGGRLDATNVVPDPAMTIITTISNDHAKFLGPTLPRIAGEKAGILKPGTPCILGYQTQEGLEAGVDIIFEHKAEEVTAPLFKAGGEWAIHQTEKGCLFNGFGCEIETPSPNLTGGHQILNAGAAIACLVYLRQNAGLDISDKAICEGIQNARWQARLQRLTEQESRMNVPLSLELWLDGGHNDSAGAVLAEQAERWNIEDGRDLHLVVAMLNTKSPVEFLERLGPKATSIICIPVPGDDLSFAPDELKDQLQHIQGLPGIEMAPDWPAAIQSCIQSEREGRILTCGSLYLAGHILSKRG